MLMNSNQISHFFKNSAYPVDYTVYVATGENQLDFQVLESSLGQPEDKTLCMYQVVPLLRLILRKEGHIDTETYSETFTEKKKELCHIIEWTPTQRSFVIFNFDNCKVFDDEQFIKDLQIHHSYFQNLLPAIKEEK